MPSDGSLLRVVSMMMDMEGWHDLRGNEARLQLADEAMTWMRDVARAHLILFPAGYLYASTLSEARELAERIVALARQRSIAVVLGVDISNTGELKRGLSKAGSKDTDLLVTQGLLPFFLFAWSPGMPSSVEWRQRSTTSENWALAPLPERGERRILKVNGQWVDVVACGEAFNRELRVGIGQNPEKTVAVVIAAHTAQGSRIWNATEYFASSVGLPTLLSVHQIGIQHGEMRRPQSADYVQAGMTRSLGSPPKLHAGVFAVSAADETPQ
jgi:hypothetical protein